MAYDAEDKETKAAIAKAVSDATVSAVEEAVTGLKTKNTELLAKLKKAQRDSTIDPADHQALQLELDESEKSLATANKALKTATTESDTIKKKFETESKVSHDLLVDTGLSDALLANGVKTPSFLKAAKAMLSGKVTLELDGDKRVAKVGDKSLEDFVKEWATGDEGKTFVSANSNNGGGATGGTKGMSAEDLSKLSPEARLQKVNETGAEAK